jgi:site-specific DNA-methyltransferase (adenine-specific)
VGTSTSNFGVGRREGHDASGFYGRFGTPVVSTDDTVTVAPETDRIWVHDARDMAVLPGNSVALVVTSPPYFAGKAYEEALGEGHIPADYVAYLEMLHGVFAECSRVLEPGGRIAVNVANLGRKPYRSLSADVTGLLQDRLGLLLRGEIIWRKARGAGGNCAWGSFQTAKNPVLRDVTERIVVASKGRFDRARPTATREEGGLPTRSTIGRDAFLDLTLDLWEFPPESACRVGHPAPFPVELPRRLIELYTFEGDLVLDPFMGSGSTGIAAVGTARRWAGFDTDPAYAEAATKRIEAAIHDRGLDEPGLDEADRDPPTLFETLAASRGDEVEEPFDVVARARENGTQAAVRKLLGHCGFGDELRTSAPFPVGVEVDVAATDGAGDQWYFDVVGAFTTRPGLRQADMLWKALGKAAILQTQFPDDQRPCRYVLLTTDVPTHGSPGGKALRAAHGAGLIWDVLVLDRPETVTELLHVASGTRSGQPSVLTCYR